MARDTDTRLLDEFEEVLAREQHALVTGDAAAVETAAREKHAMAVRLATVGEEWPGRRERVARLAEANAQNGRLIAWRLARLDERLAALGVLSPEGSTYDALGSLQGRISRGPGATGYG